MFKESKYIKSANIKVLTPFGYQLVEYIHRTHLTRSLKIVHSTGELVVAKYHTFVIHGKEKSAESLKPGDYLETTQGDSKVLSIEEAGELELYDLSLDQSEIENFWYYTNGVLSHNSGKSITTACYLTWLFNFHKDMNIGIVANRAAQAREFLQNTKDVFSRLPIWLMQGVNVWNKTNISNELGMRILTDVPSGDAFRGYTINCLVVDECVHRNETVTIRDKVTGEIITLSIEDLYEKI